MFLGKIGIDIKLILAQLLNFVLLLIILNRILYRPLLKKLKERAEKIKNLQEKEKNLRQKEEEIKKRKEELIQKTKERARKILEEVKKISQEEREEMLKRTEKEIRELMEETEEKIKLEIKKIKEREKKEAAEFAKNLLEKVLSKSITQGIHEKYLKEIIEELESEDFEEMKGEKEIKIVSAFPLKEKEREIILSILSKKIRILKVKEEVKGELIAGIQILIDGYLLDGSIKGKIDEEIKRI
jgi:F-type H+-transporting ATPase subunit b